MMAKTATKPPKEAPKPTNGKVKVTNGVVSVQERSELDREIARRQQLEVQQESERTIWQAEQDGLRGEIAALRTQLSQQRDLTGNAREAAMRLEARLAESEDDNDDLHLNLVSAQGHVQVLKRERDRLADERDGLEQRLFESRKDAIDSARRSDALGESILHAIECGEVRLAAVRLRELG